MKIVISTGDGWSSRYIVLDAEHAGLAAQMLASARVYEADGDTPNGRHYKLDRKSALNVTYATNAQFDELPEAVVVARKSEADANQARWKAENRTREIEKELAEAKAALTALQSTVVCTVAEPEPVPEVDDDDGLGDDE